MIKEEFLVQEDGDSHRHLLWFALNLTSLSALPVIEFGAGYGSTKYLRNYCLDTERKFISYENHKEWSEQWGSTLITDWLEPELYVPASVVLIDQSPADERHHSAWMFKDKATIVVIHDAEPPWDTNSYQLDKIWHLYKHRVFIRGPKIWTVALSNQVNLTKHIGTTIGKFKIEQ